MMRRPSVRRQSGGLSLGSMSPEVKEELNEIALMFFREARKRLEQKIEADEFKELTLKELMKEFNSMVKSLQGPATSITAIGLPTQSQDPNLEGQPRAHEIKNAALDPEKLSEMRERQSRFLEQENEPG